MLMGEPNNNIIIRCIVWYLMTRDKYNYAIYEKPIEMCFCLK